MIALWLAVVTGLLLGVIGTFAAAAASLVLRGNRAMPENRFGICSGFAPGDPCPPGTPRSEDLQVGPDRRLMPKPLTTWLADELDALAGKTDPSEPLHPARFADAAVNLKMFTTNLTDGTPYTMPFRNRMFFFSPDEFRELFPPRIVDWLDGVGGRRPCGQDREGGRGLRRDAPQGHLALPTRRTCPWW